VLAKELRLSSRVAQTARDLSTATFASFVEEALIAVERSFGALRQPQDDMLRAGVQVTAINSVFSCFFPSMRQGNSKGWSPTNRRKDPVARASY
jgi:hypothetical protein